MKIRVNRWVKDAIVMMVIYTVILALLWARMQGQIVFDLESYVDSQDYVAQEVSFVPQDPWTLLEAGIRFGEKTSYGYEIIVVDYKKVYSWTGAPPMLVHNGKYYAIHSSGSLGLSPRQGTPIFTYLTFIGVLGWTATIAAAFYLRTKHKEAKTAE